MVEGMVNERDERQELRTVVIALLTHLHLAQKYQGAGQEARMDISLNAAIANAQRLAMLLGIRRRVAAASPSYVADTIRR